MIKEEKIMGVILLITMIFLILIVLGIVLGTVWLLTTFWSVSIIFSRIAFSLLLAIPMNSSWHLVDGKLNFWIWAAVNLGIIFLLSLLPRANAAIKFFATLVISVLVSDIVLLFAGSIIGMVINHEFIITVTYEIILKVICTFISIGALQVEVEESTYGTVTNPIAIYAEKIIAAAVYGASATFICASMNGNWEWAAWIQWLIFIGVTAVAFVADRVMTGE